MRWNSVLAALLGVWMGVASAQALRAQFQEGSAPKYLEANATHPVPYGLCPDIMAALERQDANLRFALDPVPRPQKRIEFDLGTGAMDVMCGLLISPERLQVAYPLETPVYMISERLAGRKDDTLAVASLDDLARSGSLVAVQSGAAYLRKLKEAGVQVVESGGSDVAVRAVANGRARFFYTNSLTASHFIASEKLGGKLRLHPGVLDMSPAYFWVAKHVDPEVVKRLEAAMKGLKRSGELDRIYARYD